MDPQTAMMLAELAAQMMKGPDAPPLPNSNAGMSPMGPPTSSQLFQPGNLGALPSNVGEMSLPPADPFTQMSHPGINESVSDVLRPGANASKYQAAIKSGMTPQKSVYGDPMTDGVGPDPTKTGMGTMDKIGMGAEIGGAVSSALPKPPPPPSLPGGAGLSRIDPVSVQFMLRQMRR